jgi:hypothetical protein
MKSFFEKRSEKKEMKRAAEDRIRDEKLNSIILNAGDADTARNMVSKPYDVNYDAEGHSEKRSPSAADTDLIMVQLVENTKLSSRKFLLNPANTIRIGSGLSDNDIVAANSGIEEHQCEIFLAQNKVYVRNTARVVRTIVRRKKKQTIADEKGLRLLSGDQIILEDIVYDITLIET